MEGSGWTQLITSSSVLTAGKSNAMLTGSSNVVLCRYIHQVTVCALNIKKQEAFQKYVETSSVYPLMSFDIWERFCADYPMFKCDLVIELELLLLLLSNLLEVEISQCTLKAC